MCVSLYNMDVQFLDFKFIFTKKYMYAILRVKNSSGNYYYYWRTQHASLETDMPHRRPTCLIEDLSDTNMPAESQHIYLNILILIYCLLFYIDILELWLLRLRRPSQPPVFRVGLGTLSCISLYSTN